MRRGCVSAVSSALLFVSIALAPHHLLPGLAGTPATQVLITEFYPCALSGDEYIVISCACTTRIDLANWSVTDGEGTIRFTKDIWLEPSDRLVVSANSTAYLEAFGTPPDLAMDESSGRLERSGVLRLADSGDSLALISPAGVQADFVKYGTTSDSSPSWRGVAVPTLRQGEVARRVHSAARWQDTDSACDWEPFREFRYGYTDLAPLRAKVDAGDLVAFASPDCSLQVVLDSLRSASQSIRLCTYELSSAAVCMELLKAAQRGVSVRILVDGAPAGGMSAREQECLSAMAAAGLDVATLNGNLSEKVVQHLGPLHSKYAVVDCYESLVLSENFVEDGIPLDEVVGNRGWGVSISNPAVASYLASLFDSDARPTRPDVKPWITDAQFSRNASVPAPPPSNYSRTALTPLHTSSDAWVQIVLSPDASEMAPFLVPLLSGAGSMIIEQFQVDLDWQTRWSGVKALSPLLGSVLQAMRAGSSTRMLFDSSWFNAEGNGPAMRYMAGACANESLRGQFKLMDPRNPIKVVHNKGAIIDGRATLISSNNWGFSSFARNRELAALVESDEVGAYFTRAFEMDWSPDDTPPVAEAGADIAVHPGETVYLDGLNSTDDRVVARFGWDLNGDGAYESPGPRAMFIPDHAGRFEVMLKVEDGWGNQGFDSMNVTVLPLGGTSPQASFEWILSCAAGSSAAAVGLLVGRKLALRRTAVPGKVNQPR